MSTTRTADEQERLMRNYRRSYGSTEPTVDQLNTQLLSMQKRLREWQVLCQKQFERCTCTANIPTTWQRQAVARYCNWCQLYVWMLWPRRELLSYQFVVDLDQSRGQHQENNNG